MARSLQLIKCNNKIQNKMKNNKVLVWVAGEITSTSLKAVLKRGTKNNSNGNLTSYTFIDMSKSDAITVSKCPQMFVVERTDVADGTFVELNWEERTGNLEFGRTGFFDEETGSKNGLVDIYAYRKEINWTAIGSVDSETATKFMSCINQALKVLENLDNYNGSPFKTK